MDDESDLPRPALYEGRVEEVEGLRQTLLRCPEQAQMPGAGGEGSEAARSGFRQCLPGLPRSARVCWISAAQR